MKWRGDEAAGKIRLSLQQRVDMAARVVRDHARELVSRDQPVKIYAKAAGRSRKGLEPSRPGEPPKKVTGHLRMNIQKEVSTDGMSARIGTNVPYGKMLELGTSRNLAPRPWLKRAITDTAAEVRRRFNVGVKF